MSKYVNDNGVSEMWTNTKNYISAQLLGKSDVGHTHSASDITSGLSTVATSGSYNDLSNKPTIPTVNNATLTIQQNGVNVQTFTANQSTNATANITVPTKTSDLTNDSGFITSDNTKIPLAGSNQISGSLIPATTEAYDLGGSSYQWNNAYIKSLTINGTACGDILTHNAGEFVPRSGGAVMTSYFLGRSKNTGTFMVSGGTTATNGANIEVFGSDSTSYFAGAVSLNSTSASIYLERSNIFRPSTNGTVALGAGSYRWGQIYSSNSSISTSDSRLKNSVKDIDDALLDAWGNIEPKQYKFNDATEKKGEKARFHTGYLAQDIKKACTDNNIDATRYGLFCYDSWEEEPEISEDVEVEKDGVKTIEKRVIQPKREKGDAYSLRYEEALVVECKYLRRCIARLTARIEQLEKGNNIK